MAETKSTVDFEELVEWACSTLPQGIRDLSDFPGIQLVPEPPVEMFERMSAEGHWPEGTELLGCFVGVRRTERRVSHVRFSPDLIFVFQNPILRCSRGNLPAEVKRVVWHEVAHWLGHNEEEVRALGLSAGSQDMSHPFVTEIPPMKWQPALAENTREVENPSNQPRCVKCYSAEVSCQQVEKPSSKSAAWRIYPEIVRTTRYTCRACGYEWDDGDE